MTEKQLTIGNVHVGDGRPFFTIAEIGSNFDRDLDRAKMLIRLAKDSGADAVKFQSFRSRDLVSPTGFADLKIGYQRSWDRPVEKVYSDAEFPREWHQEISDYCQGQEIIFFSAPYDFGAVELLEKLKVPLYKIGSGDLGHGELIRFIAEQGKPVIIATGASTMEEIDYAINIIKTTGNNQIILLQCVTNYPASFDNINASVLRMFRDRYDTLTGYSDHTPGYLVALATIGCGGCMIEKHFTDDKTRPGPDHPFAMDPEDFRSMVDKIRLMEKLVGQPVKKIYEEEKETAIIMKRGVRARVTIGQGETILQEHLEVLRPREPETICASNIQMVIGRKAAKDIKKHQSIAVSDLT